MGFSVFFVCAENAKVQKPHAENAETTFLIIWLKNAPLPCIERAIQFFNALLEWIFSRNKFDQVFVHVLFQQLINCRKFKTNSVNWTNNKFLVFFHCRTPPLKIICNACRTTESCRTCRTCRTDFLQNVQNVQNVHISGHSITMNHHQQTALSHAKALKYSAHFNTLKH